MEKTLKIIGIILVSLIAVAIASNFIGGSHLQKEEKKEELMVSETITINHEGKLYHPLVVAKTPDSSSMATKLCLETISPAKILIASVRWVAITEDGVATV